MEVSACLARGEDWSGKDSESDDEEGEEEEEEEGGGGGNESGVSSPDVGPVTKKTKVSRGVKIPSKMKTAGKRSFCGVLFRTNFNFSIHLTAELSLGCVWSSSNI